MKYTDKEILQRVTSDLAGAKNNQVRQMALINEARDEAEGKPYDNSAPDTQWGKKAAYSSIVVKLIKKSIESSVPSLVEPFLGSNIVSARGRDVMSQQKAESAQAVLNYFWNYGIRPEELMEPLVRDLQTDGTVIGKAVWNEGKPDTDLTPLDNLTFDPSAEKLDDCNFIVEKSKVMIADILSNPQWYGKHTLDSLKDLMAASDTEWDREADGKDNSFNFDDRFRQLIEINTYYGRMEMNGGLAPIIAIWSDNTLLHFGDSPYPDSWNGLPFFGTVYIPQPGSLYGKGIGEVVSTDQKVSTALQRAIMRQLDNSTIGQRGFREGALNPIEEAKFKNGMDFKYQDKAPEFWEGSFTQLGSEVFGMQDRIKADVEELLGIGRLNAGLDPRALNSNVSATAASLVNTNAQRRLLLIMRHVSAMLEGMFRKWLDLTILMNPDLLVEVGGEMVSLQGFDLDGNYDLIIDVTTDSQKQEKAGQLNMVLQTLGNTPGIPPSILMRTTADLMKNLGQYDTATQLNGVAEQMAQAEQQPNPMEQMQTQLAVKREMAEQAELQSKTKLNEAKAMESFVDSQNASYGL